MYVCAGIPRTGHLTVSPSSLRHMVCGFCLACDYTAPGCGHILAHGEHGDGANDCGAAAAADGVRCARVSERATEGVSESESESECERE